MSGSQIFIWDEVWGGENDDKWNGEGGGLGVSDGGMEAAEIRSRGRHLYVSARFSLQSQNSTILQSF